MTSRLLAITAAIVAASCSGPAPDPAAQKASVPVLVVPVQREPAARTFEAGGTVRALTVAPLSSRIVSPILDIHAAAGDRVRRGQRLVTLDARDLAASASTADAALHASLQGAAAAEADERAAEAALALAQASHRRIAGLRERNSATAGELDDTVAALRSAEARLDAARARRAQAADAINAARSGAEGARVSASYAVISAPFDGLVTDRPAEAGTMAAPGVPLIVVEDTSRYRLDVSVDAARAGAIRIGATVPVQVAGLEPAEGRIAEAIESIDPAAHTFIVKIDLPPHPGLRSGLFGRARLTAGEDEGMAIPATAVVRRGQLTIVFTEEQGVARMRVIHAGEALGERVRVLAGLDPGDRVIQHPPPHLLDGDPVTVQAGRLP